MVEASKDRLALREPRLGDWIHSERSLSYLIDRELCQIRCIICLANIKLTNYSPATKMMKFS